MALYKNVLHHSANVLPTWWLEIIGVYVSLLNRCRYCVDHHAAGLARLQADEARALAIRSALEADVLEGFDPRERAMLAYARALTVAHDAWRRPGPLTGRYGGRRLVARLSLPSTAGAIAHHPRLNRVARPRESEHHSRLTRSAPNRTVCVREADPLGPEGDSRMNLRPSSRRRSRTLAIGAAVALAIAVPASALGNHAFPNPAPYVALTAAAGAGQIVPLINSGDEYHGVTFEGIPDGIGVVPGDGTVDLYVAHEQSHVPFSGFADFQDSSVSRVTVDVAQKQVVGLEVALSPDLGFLRFCSAFMAGPEHGFADYTFFVNEETNDIVTVPAGAPYGADPAIAPYRQGGYAVALNTATDDVTTLSRMGRHNHENTVFVPGGWKWTVSLSGDDTFTAPSSQLYLHTATDPNQVLSDKGQLWAFQVTAANGSAVDPYDPYNDANDYLEIDPGDTFSGRFIHVPTDVARGLTDEAPQDALENWSNANNVFQFVRVEDIAYDPDDPRTVYFADTGTSRLAENTTTGRLVRLGSGGTTSNGRIFKMVLNATDPRIVDSLTILVDGGHIGMRSPDNMDVGHNSIMVQEDASNAKVWRYDIATETWSHVATATQPSAETSGIVDVSEWLGAGWWALDVQSHTNQSVGTVDLTYTPPLGGTTLTYRERREDGQLLLMHIPGS